MSSTSFSGLSCAVLIPIVIHGFCSVLEAQAWTPEKREGTVSLTYQNYDVAGHYDAQGRKNNNGGTQSHAVITDIDYGITDTISVTAGLPFIASKYTGPDVYFVGDVKTTPGPLDDRTYHGAFQDLRLEVRRQFWAGPVPVAPFIAASFPTHDYETQGEAVPGRGRRDLQVGASLGLNLNRVLDGAYAYGRYGYATAQRIEGFAFTRSNVDIEVGAPVRPRVVVRGLASWQIRHRGPSVNQLKVDWADHDRFIAPSYTNLGVGVSVPIGTADVYAMWVGTAAGSNGAHRGRTIGAGVTFGFGSGLSGLGGPTASVSPSRSRSSRGRFGRR